MHNAVTFVCRGLGSCVVFRWGGGQRAGRAGQAAVIASGLEQSGEQLSWWNTVDVSPSGLFAVRSFAYSDPWCGELRGDTDPELAAALCGWIWIRTLEQGFTSLLHSVRVLRLVLFSSA